MIFHCDNCKNVFDFCAAQALPGLRSSIKDISASVSLKKELHFSLLRKMPGV